MRSVFLLVVFLLVTTLASLVAAASPAAGTRSYEHALNLYNHTDYPAAIADLRELPPEARNFELLGRCYLMTAEYRKATEALEKAAALDGRNSMIFTWLGRAWGRRAETSFAVTAVAHATKAREALEKAVQLDPGNGEAIDDLFDFYIEAPGFMGGGFDKAHQLIPMIGKIDPAQAHYANARLAERKKDFDTAEEQFRSALQLAPNEMSRVLELAKFLSKRGRTAESDKLYDQAVRLNPASPRLLFARAEMWIQSGRNVEQARDLLKKYLSCVNLRPEDPSRIEALALLKKAGGL